MKSKNITAIISRTKPSVHRYAFAYFAFRSTIS